MAKGKIIADGPIKEIIINEDALKKASVAPPEITKIFSLLKDRGFPRDILEVDEAIKVLIPEDVSS